MPPDGVQVEGKPSRQGEGSCRLPAPRLPLGVKGGRAEMPSHKDARGRRSGVACAALETVPAEGRTTDAHAAFTTAVAAVAFWAAWFVSAALPVPLLWYLPLEHRLVFGAQPAGLAMCLWGQLLFSGAIAGSTAGAIWFAARRRDVGRSHVWLSVAWCALLVCFVVGYFAFAMWGRVPMIVLAPEAGDGL